jgi:ATP/maltotriose-dependent transcriptional regulator MalT
MDDYLVIEADPVHHSAAFLLEHPPRHLHIAT